MKTWLWRPLLIAVIIACGLPLTAVLAQQALLLMGVGGGSVAAASIPAITSNTTYYVCAKANGGTCVYNADGGTVAATIADSNNCTAKATPCRTLAGVQTKLAGTIIAAVVTIQLADTAGTGSDLYEPNGTVFDNTIMSGPPSSAIFDQEQGNGLGAYPNYYLYFHGNDSTPANVLVCGSSTCSTTATDARGLVLTNTLARISGIKFEYYTSSASSAGLQVVRSVAYMDNLIYVGTGAASDQEWLVMCFDHSICKFGGTHTVTNAGLIQSANYIQANFRTPAGRANVTGTVAASTFTNGFISSNENSYIAVDGLTLTVSGAGTYFLERAYNHSTIYWNDDSTFTSPAWSWTVNGSNLTMDDSQDGSFLNDLCRTTGQLTCTIANSGNILRRAHATRNSYLHYITYGAGTTNQSVADIGSTIIADSGEAFTTIVAATFGNLPTTGATNGNMAYCSDCTQTSPCAASGTGALAVRINGAWTCKSGL